MTLLAALQLADSAFPIGGYALSHGLETAVERGEARTLADVEDYLRALLGGQLAGTDLAAVVLAHRRSGSPDLLAALDRALNAQKLVREPRESARRAGRALLGAAAALGVDDEVGAYRRLVLAGTSPGMHAVAHGAVTRALGLDELTAGRVFAHALALGLLNAAVRLLPLDHLDVQRALRRAGGAIEAALEEGVRVADDGEPFWSFAPGAELFALGHEHGSARAFAT